MRNTAFTVRSSQAYGEWRTCGVEGCGERAYGSPYCYECTAQIDAINGWHRLHDGRESRVRMALFHAWRAVRRGLWIPLTAFVIVALMIMGSAWAPAVVEWLEGGSW